MLRNVQVAVILQHTGKLHAGVIAPVKFVEILPIKGQGDLLSAVAPEVKENHAVAVGDLGHRRAVASHHEGREILIDTAQFGAVSLDGLRCRSESASLPLYMGAPAGFHHGPVGLVTIHSYLHTAAAGGDGVIIARLPQSGQHILQLSYILQGGGGGHVPAVQQDVAVSFLYPGGLGGLQQGDQMADIGMNVAVGEQTQEMQRMAGLGVIDEIQPGGGLKQRAVLDGFAHQLRPLRIYLSAAQGVVPHFTVAHVLVGGQANGGAVSLQIGVGAGGQQLIQGRGVGLLHCIAGTLVALAHAVHNDQYDRFFHIAIPPFAAGAA